MSVFHSFLFPNNISPYGYVLSCSSISHLMDILVVSKSSFSRWTKPCLRIPSYLWPSRLTHENILLLQVEASLMCEDSPPSNQLQVAMGWGDIWATPSLTTWLTFLWQTPAYHTYPKSAIVSEEYHSNYLPFIHSCYINDKITSWMGIILKGLFKKRAHSIFF